MKSILLSTALLGSVFAVGCAAGPEDAAKPAGGEVYYRTGSNIPVRDRTPLTKEQKGRQAEEAQRQLQDMQTTSPGKAN